jgi:hypothetical protein
MRVAPAVWLPLLALVAGCPPRQTHTVVGKRSALDFAIPKPHLAAGGAHVPVYVTLHDKTVAAKFASAASSHPEVATAEPFDYAPENLAIVTGQPGTTEISLYDSAGKLLDAVDVEITAAAEVDLTTPLATDKPPTVLADVPLHVHAQALAADGLPLMGFWAVRVEAWGAIEMPELEHDHMPDADLAFRAYGPPAATIGLVAYGARHDVPLSVVTVADITRVDLARDDRYPAQVLVTPYAGSEPVYGARCNWTTSRSGASAIEPAASSFELDGNPTEVIYFYLNSTEPATVTCTIGTAQATIDVHR